MRWPTQRQLLLFLYSTPNMVGATLGLIGIALFLTDVIHNYWLLIILGLYAIGYIATPRNPQLTLQLHQALGTEELRQELDTLVARVRKRLPKEILVQVEEIKTLILEMLPTISDMEQADRNLYLVRQTVLDYLPQALEHYLSLPPAYANLHPIQDGKTARLLLEEQLTLLRDQMQQIQRDLHQRDADALVAHTRFLQETIGQSQGFEFVPK